MFQPVARRVVVEPLGPEAFLTGGIRWEQVFSCAESNSKNLSEIIAVSNQNALRSWLSAPEVLHTHLHPETIHPIHPRC